MRCDMKQINSILLRYNSGISLYFKLTFVQLKMYFLIFFCTIFYVQMSESVDLILDHMNLLNTTYLPGYYNISELRVTKFSRNEYGVNANFELFIDFDEKIYLEIQLYMKRIMGHEYAKSPFGFQRKPFPEAFQKYYVIQKKIIDGMQGYSNIPPLTKGERYIWKKVQSISIFEEKLF